LDECVKKSLLAAVSEDVDSVRKLATFIDEIPKPDQGNRPISRKLNSEALELLRKNDFDSAVNIFKSAVKENPKDVEINSNLGFALVKGGRYKEAIAVLHNPLILDPRRTSTWTPLAEAYALDNKQNEALASMWIGLQWSADREKSVSYYAERIEKEKNDRPQLFELYKSILDWANGKKPDIRI
jgi:predicted Zn-dependent protease